MKLIVGLGNIGAGYSKTRHNIGFMVVDHIAESQNATWKHETKLKSLVTSIELEGSKIILAKPDTFMNLSGEAIQRLVQFYKLSPAADLWTVFDDLDVPFGRMRLRSGGTSGGHQGISSTISHIGTNFMRARVGISLNDRSVEPSEVYVLKPFSATELPNLPKVIDAAATIIQDQLRLASPDEATYDLLS